MSYCLSPEQWKSLTKAQRQAAIQIDGAYLKDYEDSDEYWDDLLDASEYRHKKLEEARKRRGEITDKEAEKEYKKKGKNK